MKFQITGKGWTSVVEIEDNTVKVTENDCISIFTGKNWEYIRGKCAEYGWDVEEIDEITFMEPTATIHIGWPFPETDDAEQI